MDMDTNFQPCWQCESCNLTWPRIGSDTCECGKPARKALNTSDGRVQAISKSVEAPVRQVVSMNPDESGQCMLECGHIYERMGDVAGLELVTTVGCSACWRDENVHKRTVPSPRNLLLVGANEAA
jgi:hypothetical protein